MYTTMYAVVVSGDKRVHVKPDAPPALHTAVHSLDGVFLDTLIGTKGHRNL